jgi:hypothetical protein
MHDEPRILMTKIFPIYPAHPEKICWGCNQYCSAKNMMCGNGSDRTQHPFETFGKEWLIGYGPELNSIKLNGNKTSELANKKIKN